MSQTFEDWTKPYSVRCSDVGLHCNCVIFGMNEKRVMNETIVHMFEYHAIDPKEMTAQMKSRIRQSIKASSVMVRVQHAMPKLF
jgi:predicted small metal-binding protein